MTWHPHKELNPEPSVLETGALPIELCGYETVWCRKMVSSHRRLRLQRSALPLSYCGMNLAARAGIEPAALSSTGRRSATELTNRRLVEATGVEPATSCLQGRRSAN
jgi:hypothetical protein